MPKYIPNALFSDCYASVGNITFFHKDGECFFKTKARPAFPGTDIIPEFPFVAAQSWGGELDLGDDHECVWDGTCGDTEG